MGRQRAAGEWQREVEAWRASGTSAAAFAKGRGYSASSLIRWGERTPRQSFLRLEVVPSAKVAVASTLVVDVGGAQIRVERGFDPELLRSVVGALSLEGPK
ncbi:MAG: hypothetical protein U0414_21975 [Polyangiaceae bacterium]